MRTRLMALLSSATLVVMSAVVMPTVSAEGANYIAHSGCDATLVTSWTGQSYVIATCGSTITGGSEAQGSIDCSYAPDQYTDWIGAGGKSASDLCAFGARGVSLALR